MAQAVADIDAAYERLDAINAELHELRIRQSKGDNVAQRITDHETAAAKMTKIIDAMKAGQAEADQKREQLERIRELTSNPRHAISGTSEAFNVYSRKESKMSTREHRIDPDHPFARAEDLSWEYRDCALQMVDSEYRDEFTSDQLDRIDSIIRNDDPLSLTSRFMVATGQPLYKSAFAKLLRSHPGTNPGLSDAESAAFDEVEKISAIRAMNVGANDHGGYMVPFSLDPSILLTSAGSACPIRRVADVRTISTLTWQGVSSDGVSAGFANEAAAATDNSPTLAQPVATLRRAHAFVPFSYELEQDLNTLYNELQVLLIDARAQLESTAFLSGSGTAPNPPGIIGAQGLSTAARQYTAGTAAFTAADVYALKQSLPARFAPNATFLASPAVLDSVFRLAGGGSAEPQLMPDRGGNVLGRPALEWSTMSALPTTTGEKTILFGDFSKCYTIIDHIGTRVEVVANLFDQATAMPTGQRGLYLFFRTGACVRTSAACRYLQVK